MPEGDSAARTVVESLGRKFTPIVRGIPRLDRGIRAASFDLAAVRPLHKTRGRVFGVIGLGLIGTATARKAAGLGYQVSGYDIAAEPGATTFHGFPSVSLHELLGRNIVNPEVLGAPGRNSRWATTAAASLQPA